MSKASNADQDEPLVVIARAVRTRGLKGEIVADVLTDFPDRFEKVDRLIAVSTAGERRDVQLEAYWFQKDRVILKLKGYDSIDAASEFVGYDFAVPEAERVSLPESHYYDWELEGCSVYTTGDEKLGRVAKVLRTGGVELLAVTNDQGGEYLLPMAETIVIEIDPAAGKIVVDPPEGLLDL